MNTSTRTRRIVGVIGAAAAAVLALTACSGGAAGGGEVDENGLTPLTVVHASTGYETAYLAQSQGYFEAAGLAVTLVPGGTAQDNLGQLAGGSADISTLSWDAAVTATAEGLPIRVISGNGVISDTVDTSGVVVRADSGITSVAELAGKTIAFNSIGSGGNVPVLQSLTAAGVDPASVTQVALPYASMQSSLESGQVDAVFPSDSFYAQTIADPANVVIANPSREFRAGLGITIWGATEPWLAENAETAAKFNEAMEQAIAFYSDEANQEAVYQVRAEVTGRPIEEVSGPLTACRLALDPVVSQATTDALVENGFVTEPKGVDDILWAEAPRV